MHLIYKNRFNEVKAYSVNVIAENDEYLDVFDRDADRIKTFKQSNILSRENTFEEASDKAETLQNDYQRIERKISSGKRMPSRDNWANRENKFEVCFTGFAKDEKAELIRFAKENELFIRTAVSKNLGLLVCGKSAGWKKLEVANKLNVPRVIGAEGFYTFLETGEFSE
mgnify:CR=1 FL=1